MKSFKVTIEFYGLTGKYTSEVEVRARDPKSAEKKAAKVIGNRDGFIQSCKEIAK